VVNRKAWPKLEAYVKDLIGRFRSDPRVLAWDLYNEPGNTNMTSRMEDVAKKAGVSVSTLNDAMNGTGDVDPKTRKRILEVVGQLMNERGKASLPLLEAVFRWARNCGPSQPLTVGIWANLKEVNDTVYDQADIISFHSYSGAEAMEATIKDLSQRGRPLICTEWLHRPRGCTVCSILPLLYKHRVGSMHWGLVNGKTQTNYTWGSKAGTPAPKVWQCDLFGGDFTPYDPNEVELFRHYIRASTGSTR